VCQKVIIQTCMYLCMYVWQMGNTQHMDDDVCALGEGCVPNGNTGLYVCIYACMHVCMYCKWAIHNILIDAYTHTGMSRYTYTHADMYGREFGRTVHTYMHTYMHT
jgi:hypothetical protein